MFHYTIHSIFDSSLWWVFSSPPTAFFLLLFALHSSMFLLRFLLFHSHLKSKLRFVRKANEIWRTNWTNSTFKFHADRYYREHITAQSPCPFRSTDWNGKPSLVFPSPHLYNILCKWWAFCSLMIYRRMIHWQRFAYSLRLNSRYPASNFQKLSPSTKTYAINHVTHILEPVDTLPTKFPGIFI